MSDFLEVAGYPIDPDRAYHPETHLWVDVGDGQSVRIGLDALGVETSGTLAQLALLPAGTEVVRGDPFGSLEAAKFVGPLISPLSGRVVASNQTVVADPRLVEQDPYGAGWLVIIEPSRLEAELPELVQGTEAVAAWFEAEVADFRLKGVLAE
jgi:glycine cleavage system H protein